MGTPGLDPVIVKELSGASRRWTLYALRIVYVAGIGLVVWQFWDRVSRQLAYSRSLSEMAGLGRELFEGFVALQMVFASVAGVAAAADLVAKEVRAGTLGLLSLTPLSPWRIAAGKWKAAMAECGTLILSGLPVLAACFYLGGVGLWEVCWGTTLSLALAALSTATALFFSTLFRAGTVALIVALLATIGHTALAAWMCDLGAEDTMAYLHPAIAAAAAAAPGGRAPEFGWIVATAVTLALSGVLLRAAAARIEVLATAVARPPVLTRAMEAMDRFYEDINPCRWKNIRIFAGKEGVWERHAILWKELRTRAAGKLRYATRIGLGLFLFLLLPLSLAISGEDEWHVPAIWFSGVLLLLMAMANGVGLFVREKEERKWDILLSTPLTPWEIVRAKLAAGLASLAPLALILLFFFSLVAWIYGLGVLGWMMTAGTIGLAVLFAYAVAAWASLRSPNMRTAFSLSFGIVIALLLLFPVAVDLVDELPGVYWRKDDFPRSLVKVTSPLTFLELIARRASYWDSYWYKYVELLPWFFGYAFIYSLAIHLIIWRMLARFNRITGRS